MCNEFEKLDLFFTKPPMTMTHTWAGHQYIWQHSSCSIMLMADNWFITHIFRPNHRILFWRKDEYLTLLKSAGCDRFWADVDTHLWVVGILLGADEMKDRTDRFITVTINNSKFKQEFMWFWINCSSKCCIHIDFIYLFFYWSSIASHYRSNISKYHNAYHS